MSYFFVGICRLVQCCDHVVGVTWSPSWCTACTSTLAECKTTCMARLPPRPLLRKAWAPPSPQHFCQSLESGLGLVAAFHSYLLDIDPTTVGADFPDMSSAISLKNYFLSKTCCLVNSILQGLLSLKWHKLWDACSLIRQLPGCAGCFLLLSLGGALGMLAGNTK